MKMLWIIALKELRDGIRNRWIAAAIILLGTLALALSLLGSAPTGSIRASSLDIMVINLANLSVYLIPLIALMLSYDSLVAEFERGTMLLLLTYPIARWEVVMGKFVGHALILFIAIFLGYGGAVVILLASGQADIAGWQAYLSMMFSSLLLGCVFIALGYLLSILVRERATAAGSAIALWLIFVVLYDLLLFGLLLLDDQQIISQQLLSMLMLASPTDSYRLINLSLFEEVRHASGISALAVGDTGLSASLLSGVMVLWLLVPLTAVLLIFQRREL
jgi:Cu-processing system permease protein